MCTLSEENEAKIPEWNKRWLEDVILRTKPMTPQDKIEVEIAVREIHRLGKLDGDNVKVIFVRSPFAALFEAEAESKAAIHEDNTNFRFNSLYNMISSTENSASFSVTRNLVHNATYSHTFHATYKAINDALNKAVGRDKYAWSGSSSVWYDGGNLYSFRCSLVSFARDIIGIKCKEPKYHRHYETCTRLSGPRYMHEKFCVISDFPIELNYYTRNGELVAHNDKGPSHLWADGFAIWTINGIAVTEQIVMSPETLTIDQIDAEVNEEIKRVMIERFTWTRYITETNAECLDARINDVDGTSEALMALKDKSIRLLCACKSTARVYAIRVNSRIKNCQEAQSWMSGDKKINVIGVS